MRCLIRVSNKGCKRGREQSFLEHSPPRRFTPFSVRKSTNSKRTSLPKRKLQPVPVAWEEKLTAWGPVPVQTIVDAAVGLPGRPDDLERSARSAMAWKGGEKASDRDRGNSAHEPQKAILDY